MEWHTRNLEARPVAVATPNPSASASSPTAAGHNVSEPTITPQVHLSILDDTDNEAKWHAARQPLQSCINRMGAFYWQMLTRT